MDEEKKEKLKAIMDEVHDIARKLGELAGEAAKVDNAFGGNITIEATNTFGKAIVGVAASTSGEDSIVMAREAIAEGARSAQKVLGLTDEQLKEVLDNLGVSMSDLKEEGEEKTAVPPEKFDVDKVLADILGKRKPGSNQPDGSN